MSKAPSSTQIRPGEPTGPGLRQTAPEARQLRETGVEPLAHLRDIGDAAARGRIEDHRPSDVHVGRRISILELEEGSVQRCQMIGQGCGGFPI